MPAKKTAPVARETSPRTPSAETALQIQAPPDGAPRQVMQEGGAAVWMPPERASGIRAFGQLVPGTVYVVAPAEALRLVTVKGFRFAGMADHEAVSNHIDGIADAISNNSKE